MRTLILIGFLLIPVFSVWSSPLGGKIIGFGGGGGPGGTPDAQYFHDTIAAMEEALPVDGVLVCVNPVVGGKSCYLADSWFGSLRFEPNQFTRGIELLRTVKTKHFTTNLLRVNFLPADVDWFDDAGWNTILHNAQILATIVRDGRLAGIFLDTEQYWSGSGVAAFALSTQKPKVKHTFDEYQAQVRKRGKQLIDVWSGQCPGIQIILTYATSQSAREIGFEGQLPLEQSSMPLMPAFVDGLLTAENASIYDGYEASYGYKSYSQFADARQKIKKASARLSADKTNYEKIKVAFAVWPAAGEDPNLFNQRNFTKNVYSPADVAHALSYALEESDGCVWLYLGASPVFGGNFKLAPQYKNAILRSKVTYDHNWVSPSQKKELVDPNVTIVEAEDMSPRQTEGSGMEILDSAIGMQNWGQHGKMVAVVTGIDATGTVRFTLNREIPDGIYKVALRLQYPNGKDTTTFEWRDGTQDGSPAVVEPKTDWTAVQMGDKAKGTWVGYAGWTWVEIAGPKKFANIKPGRYYIDIKDNDKATYDFVYVDEVKFTKVK
jgi:hypothetical protein